MYGADDDSHGNVLVIVAALDGAAALHIACPILVLCLVVAAVRA